MASNVFLIDPKYKLSQINDWTTNLVSGTMRRKIMLLILIDNKLCGDLKYFEELEENELVFVILSSFHAKTGHMVIGKKMGDKFFMIDSNKFPLEDYGPKNEIFFSLLASQEEYFLNDSLFYTGIGGVGTMTGETTGTMRDAITTCSYYEYFKDTIIDWTIKLRKFFSKQEQDYPLRVPLDEVRFERTKDVEFEILCLNLNFSVDWGRGAMCSFIAFFIYNMLMSIRKGKFIFEQLSKLNFVLSTWDKNPVHYEFLRQIWQPHSRMDIRPNYYILRSAETHRLNDESVNFDPYELFQQYMRENLPPPPELVRGLTADSAVQAAFENPTDYRASVVRYDSQPTAATHGINQFPLQQIKESWTKEFGNPAQKNEVGDEQELLQTQEEGDPSPKNKEGGRRKRKRKKTKKRRGKRGRKSKRRKRKSKYN